MSLIANIDVQVNATAYKISLYPNAVEVWVMKHRRGGDSYLSRIKNGSGTFRRVLAQMKREAAPGSLRAEQIAQCAII